MNNAIIETAEMVNLFIELLHKFNHSSEQVVVKTKYDEAVVEWQYGTPCMVSLVRSLNTDGYDNVISKVTELARAGELENVFIDSL